MTDRDPFPLIGETSDPSQLPTIAEWLGAGAPMREVTTPPMWVCLCGARNRLRDTACRHCGDHKPTMED